MNLLSFLFVYKTIKRSNSYITILIKMKNYVLYFVKASNPGGIYQAVAKGKSGNLAATAFEHRYNGVKVLTTNETKVDARIRLYPKGLLVKAA